MPASQGRREPEDLTLFIRGLASGSDEAAAPEMARVLAELKATACGYLSRQDPGHTLQASALVNEAYLKLFDRSAVEWADRVHFFALAARAMRQILVDHARRRNSLKGGGRHEALSVCEPATPRGSVDLDVLDLHATLEELSALDPRQGKVVEMRYFGGLEVAEVAEVLGVSKTTVEREWRMARAWLGNRMRKDRED